MEGGRGRWDWLNPLEWLPVVLCGVFILSFGAMGLAAILKAGGAGKVAPTYKRGR